MEHISVLSWMGIQGQTSWKMETLNEVDAVIGTLTGVVSVFLTAFDEIVSSMTVDH